MKVSNVCIGLLTFPFGIFSYLIKLTNACSVLLTIRFSGSMVSNVSFFHDLSCVFVCFCSLHLYLRHTTEFVDFYFSVSFVFSHAYNISTVNTSVSAMTYLVFCSRLQHLKGEHASRSVSLISSHVCVHAFCSLVVLIPRMCSVLM